MATTAVSPLDSNVPPQGVTLKTPQVKLAGLDHRLGLFLTDAGPVHTAVFEKPLVVSCGVDAVEHKTGKHTRGLAVDVRVSDLTPLQAERFLSIVCELCDRYGLTVFDERNLPGAMHYHVEVAG